MALVLIILGFGLLIFIHEAGHFLAAKWAGIRTEAFAIGMGTAVVSWRKGIGFAWGSTHQRVVAKAGKIPRELSQKELDRLGIGSTEYSLRWLPIGGFVKMLGQDDADPSYISKDEGSYNVCPIGKRMIVVSAGVVANILLAITLFIVAFMIGVQAALPVVGDVVREMPAGTARAVNAEALGISTPGLQPGDEITRIDGKPIRTFSDLRIAAAMAKPDQVLSIQVRRSGLSDFLEFRIQPVKSTSGLLGIGVDPGLSTRLFEDDKDGLILEYLEQIGLAEAGVAPGMMILSAAGRPLDTFEQFQAIVNELNGEPVPCLWSSQDKQGRPIGTPIAVEIAAVPTFQVLRYAQPLPDVDQNVETGLLGLTPLVQVADVKRGPNRDVLRTGDLILRAGSLDGPRLAQLRQEIVRRRGGEIDLVLLRDGREIDVTAEVDRKGYLNITLTLAMDYPIIADPMSRLRTTSADGDEKTVDSPVAGLLLRGRSRLDAVNDTPVTDWSSFARALRLHTRAAYSAGKPAEVNLSVTHPTPGREPETVSMRLTAEEVAELNQLGWVSELSRSLFEPTHTTLSAGGNPLRAVKMGFQETWKVVVMTYLTIDRLVRGSVGVEQVRGPVGIVDIGVQVADRGVTYLVFFLGIISVNLAVINFLPIPIVDGGLFVFLIYEKLKGRPPSLAFQNASTILGVALIATMLLVVTWNDLMRLVG